nr:MAG TPA: hypothetical protein [Caudoviricetes sp.]
MITYFKMKIKEHKIKLALYSSIEEIMNEKEDVIALIKKLYLVLKDTPVNELRDVFMEKLAEIIHKEVQETNNERIGK